MVNTRLKWIGNIKGDPGEKGDKGDTGTFASASAKSVPADQPARAVMSGPETHREVEFEIPRGLPGVNAVPADEAVSTYLSAPDSATRAAAEAAFPVKTLLPFANIADFGAKCDGVTPDDDAFMAAYAAVGPGGVITAPAGRKVALDGIDIVLEKSIVVDFSGNEIIQNSNSNVFRFTGGFDSIQTVAAIGQGDTTSDVAIGDASGYSVGDVVKVYSDDVIPGSRPGTAGGAARLGSITKVSAINGNILTVRPRLEDSYSLNIRVARMKPISVLVRVGEMYCRAEDQAAFSAAFVHFRGLKGRFEGYITRGGGPGLNTSSCWMPSCDLVVQNLLDEPGVHNGYGVNDSASALGDFIVRGTAVRHNWTDGPGGNNTQAGDPDPMAYGRSEGHRIRGSAMYTTNTAWDTHHGGRGHVFDGVTAKGCVVGVALRGHNHTVNAAEMVACTTGYRSFCEDGAESYGHLYKNCSSRGTTTAFDFTELTTRTSHIPTAIISGGAFEFSSAIINSLRGLVRVDAARFTCTAENIGTNQHFANLTSGSIKGSMAVDLTAVSAGSAYAVFNTASSVATTVELSLDIAASDYLAGNLTAVVRTASSPVDLDVRVTGSFPGNWAPITGNDLGGSRQRAVWSNRAGQGGSKVNYLSISGTTSLGIRNAGDDMVLVRLLSTGASTLSQIRPGARGGQELEIHNMNTSSGSVTVSAGSSSNVWNDGNADVVIPVGRSARFFWDGSSSLWRRSIFV